MRSSFAPPIWAPDQIAELVRAVARHAGIELETDGAIRQPLANGDTRELEIAPLIAALGLETEPMTIVGSDADTQLGDLGPAVIEVPEIGFVGLVDAQGGRARLVTTSHEPYAVRLSDLSSWLVQRGADAARGEIDRIVRECDIRSGRREHASEALLRAWAGDKKVATAWPLREHAGLDFRRQVRDAGLFGRLSGVAAAHAAEYAVWVVSWWVLGRGALSGLLDRGWLAAWALLLATLVPLRWLSLWSRAVFATGFGGLLKQRLFAGAGQLDPEIVRREGAGGLLGWMIESDTIETLALNGGLSSALAVVELIIAGAVLALGAGGLVQVAMLACWTAFAAFLAVRYMRKRLTWTQHRLRITHQLVENMAGHRTRLAQQPPEQWHDVEDAALAQYVSRSQALDRDGARLATFISRGWPMLALIGIGPTFLAVGGSVPSLAIGIGGIVLAQRALKRLTAGLAQLAGAWIAWRQVAPMFRAAVPPRPSMVWTATGPNEVGAVALDAQAVGFQYPGRAEPALQNVNLEIRRGDRVLLEGESGAGKSSLVGLLAGWRTPTSGSILAGGYDRHVLGEDAWRTRVVAAPQYHENYLVSASLAFNLLMGNRWPPTPEDLAEAESVCRGLGLGPLVDRMPAGLQQSVGESGWQLSQGERGRVFLARALLQHSDVVILDESFAALDPESLQQAVQFSAGHANTLVIVAHA
jgi:ATP-binding cassette subfamily B protein